MRRRLTDLLDVTAVLLGVAAASLAAGLWAGLAAGAVGCAALSWALEHR